MLEKNVSWYAPNDEQRKQNTDKTLVAKNLPKHLQE
jgi:hypothetical protein